MTVAKIEKQNGKKVCHDSKTFIEYSNDMYDIYKNMKNTTQIRNMKY